MQRSPRGVRPGGVGRGAELVGPGVVADQPGQAAEAGAAAGPRILVVENESFAGCGLTSSLRQDGYGAVPIDPATLARQAAAADLVVLDLDSRSGPAALDELAVLAPELRRRVLLVSAEADRWEAESQALQCYGLVDRGLGELHLLTAVADALWQAGARR